MAELLLDTRTLRSLFAERFFLFRIWTILVRISGTAPVNRHPARAPELSGRRPAFPCVSCLSIEICRVILPYWRTRPGAGSRVVWLTGAEVGLPDPDSLIVAARRQAAPIRTEDDGTDLARVAAEDQQLVTCLGIPYLYWIVFRAASTDAGSSDSP